MGWNYLATPKIQRLQRSMHIEALRIFWWSAQIWLNFILPRWPSILTSGLDLMPLTMVTFPKKNYDDKNIVKKAWPRDRRTERSHSCFVAGKTTGDTQARHVTRNAQTRHAWYVFRHSGFKMFPSWCYGHMIGMTTLLSRYMVALETHPHFTTLQSIWSVLEYRYVHGYAQLKLDMER